MTGSAIPIGQHPGEPIAAGQVHSPASGEMRPSVAQLFDLSGRVALVTGAGSGLGVVFAEALAEAGASVACVGRRLERVQQTAQQLGVGESTLLLIRSDGHVGLRADREHLQALAGYELLLRSGGS